MGAVQYIEEELDEEGVGEIVVYYSPHADKVTVIVPEGLTVSGAEVDAKYLSSLHPDAHFQRVIEAGVLEEADVLNAVLMEYQGDVHCGSCRDEWFSQLQDKVVGEY